MERGSRRKGRGVEATALDPMQQEEEEEEEKEHHGLQEPEAIAIEALVVKTAVEAEAIASL